MSCRVDWSEKLIANTGVYPEIFNGVERTSWQEGWNACITYITSEISAYTSWFAKLEPVYQEAVKTLFEELLMSRDESKVHLHLCVNDTFIYGAEAVDVPLGDLPILSDMFRVYGDDALTSYAAVNLGRGKYKNGGSFNSRVSSLTKKFKILLKEYINP